MRSTMIGAGALLVLTGCQNLLAPASDSAQARVAAAHGDVPYEGFRLSRLTPIPDENPNGVLTGPISIPGDGRAIEHVVLEIEISHSYAGDLTAWLMYDADNDGAYDAETPIELYLARPGSCASPPMWGHPVVLDDRYFFQHEEEAAALDGWDVGTFTSFRGLNRGGSFYLRIVDAGDGGDGVVRSWAVHVK
jgi:hypothetical protein